MAKLAGRGRRRTAKATATVVGSTAAVEEAATVNLSAVGSTAAMEMASTVRPAAAGGFATVRAASAVLAEHGVRRSSKSERYN